MLIKITILLVILSIVGRIVINIMISGLDTKTKALISLNHPPKWYSIMAVLYVYFLLFPTIILVVVSTVYLLFFN